MATLGDLFKMTTQGWLRSALDAPSPADITGQMIQQEIQNPTPPPPPGIASNEPQLPPAGAIFSPYEQEKAAFAEAAAPRPGEEQRGINPYSGLWGLIKRGHRIANAPIPGGAPEAPTLAAGMEGVMLTEVAPRLLGRTAGGGMDDIIRKGAAARPLGVDAPLARPPRRDRISEALLRAKAEELARQKAGDLGAAQRRIDALPHLGPGEVFYSQLKRTVESNPQRTQLADHWLRSLRKTKRRIHADELQFTGLEEYLKARGGQRVTREEILEHLAANEIQIVDVTKGGDARPYQFGTPAEQSAALRAYETAKEKVAQGDVNSPTWTADVQALQRTERRLRDTVPGWGRAEGETISPTKFQDYTLPGGKNYREVLLQLPRRGEVKEVQYEPKQMADGGAWYVLGRRPDGATFVAENLGPKATRETAQWVAQKKQQEAPTQTILEEGFSSGHWDEPNVVAHLRLADHKTPDGKRMLLLEELQSDWAQKGRKEGFDDPVRLAAADKKREQFQAFRDSLTGKYGPAFWGKLTTAERVQYDRLNEGTGKTAKGIPAAPFVGDTGKWTRLGLKRVLKMAADEGYDRVGIVRGKEQADRYNLAKQVDSVEITKGKAGYSVTARKGSRNVIDSHFVKDGDALAEVVGKELAEKAVNQNEGPVEYSGVDLQVGGEGMRKFYDEIVPQELNKLAKEFGVKVQREGGRARTDKYEIRHLKSDGMWHLVGGGPHSGKRFKTQAEAEAFVSEKGVPVHTIEVPKEMQQKIKERGFPLVSELRPGTNLGDVIARA